MNTAEFNAAFALAKSGTDLSQVSIDHLFGYGLRDFEPAVTTIEAVARIMRWQALYFNGDWDMEELNGIRHVGKKKFVIIDGEYAVVPGTFTAEQLTAIKVSARLFLANSPSHSDEA